MDSALMTRVGRKFGAEKTLEEFPWLTSWLTASPTWCKKTGGAPCEHGDGVAQWQQRESSIDGQDFVQATGAAQPQFRTDARWPYVRFDGTDDWLECTSGFGTDTVGGLYFVARFIQTVGVRVPIGSADTATANFVWGLLDAGNVPRVDVRFDNNQATDDRWQFLGTREAHRDAIGVYSLVDLGAGWVGKMGNALGTMTAITGVNAGSQMWGGVTARDNWTLGALKTSAAAASFEQFDLFECIWIDGAVAQRHATIVEYLQNKYRPKVIAHLGDSWAADTGYGIELRAALLDNMVYSHDHGIGSETITQIGTRYDANVAGKGYDLVLLEGAINNMTGIAAGGHEAVFTEFKRISDLVLASGTKLVVCNCGPFGNNASWSRVRQTELEAYNEKVLNYSRQKGVPMVDLYKFAVNDKAEDRKGQILSSDAAMPYSFKPRWELFGGFHFNTAGDPYVARYIAEIVCRELGA